MASAVIRVLFVVFDTSVFCQLFLSRLIHSSDGTKFGIFREHVDYFHFVLLRRGRPRLFEYLLQVVLFLITQTKRSTVSIYNLKMYNILLLLFPLYFIQTVEQAASPTTKKTKPE